MTAVSSTAKRRTPEKTEPAMHKALLKLISEEGLL